MFSVPVIVILFGVSCVLTEPLSQPLYPNQYVSGQTIPTIQFKPQAAGYLQQSQPQYQQQARPAAYEQATRGGGEGLQQYSSGKVGQPIQQVLLAANINGQASLKRGTHNKPATLPPPKHYTLNYMQQQSLQVNYFTLYMLYMGKLL